MHRGGECAERFEFSLRLSTDSEHRARDIQHKQFILMTKLEFLYEICSEFHTCFSRKKLK